MKTLLRSLPLALGAACLVAGSAALGDARTEAYHDDGDHNVHVRVLRHGDTDVRLRGGDVVITARDESEARITPTGDLYIRGRAVAVTDAERKQLRRYHAGIRDIEQRGMQIGQDAMHLAGGIIGTVMADLFSGDDDDRQIDRDAERQAQPLKQEAHALCEDVQAEREVQAALVAELPAFEPYAVIYAESDHDCDVDDDDTEV